MVFRKRVIFFLAIICFLTSSLSLYARGRQDPVIVEADELIEQRQNSEAIRILNELTRENPDIFDESQLRYERILRAHGLYVQIAHELLDVIDNDPDDDDRIVELSNQLRALGSVSDAETEEFLTMVRERALYNQNVRRLARIFEEARILLARGDFRGAMSVYAGGLSIYQEDFFTSAYGPEAEQLALDGLDAINQGIAAFNNLITPVTEASLQSVSNVNQDAQAVYAMYNSLIPHMENIINIMSDFSATSTEYENLHRQLPPVFPYLPNRSFLFFANRLLQGPLEESAYRTEGMIGTLNRFWEQVISRAERSVVEFAVQNYNSIYDALSNRQYQNIIPRINATQQLLSASRSFLDQRALFLESSGIYPVMIFDEPVIPQNADDFIRYRAMGQALDFFRVAVDIGQREQAIEQSGLAIFMQGTATAETAMTIEQNTRQLFINMDAEITGLENAISSEIIDYERYFTIGVTGVELDQESFVFLYQARTLAQALGTYIRQQILEAFIRQYTIANEIMERDVRRLEQDFSESSGFIRGVVTRVERDDLVTEYVTYYPREGLVLLEQLSIEIAASIIDAQELLAQYSTEPVSILNTPEGSALRTEAQSMLTRLQNMQSQTNSMIAQARINIDRAAALWAEGDRLFEESRAALERGDFATARARLQQVQSLYSESLALQESEELRAIADARLLSLGEDIILAENEFVIREVRELITQARNLFFDGNFDQAEERLVRAQNRWRDTNTTDEPEINYWLTIVRNALSLSAGREIPITAPLFAEMSQLLSDARINYNEGVSHINAGRNQEGLRYFADARNMTRQVELMFPLNREARLLDLRMEQYTDPAAFNASFQQRINSAVAGTRLRSVEAFADLQDLAEINPQFPGINQIIFQAEIDMGYRPPAPNPQALARSATLTTQAQPIVDNRNSTMYEVALTWLNEAIDLNPTNNTAIMLKDRLQILMTGQGTFVMDSRSFEEYQRAINEFNLGNRFTAWAIVQELLRNPLNQRSTQILDLQRRIEASL